MAMRIKPQEFLSIGLVSYRAFLGPQLLRLPFALALALAVDDESILPSSGLRRVTGIQPLHLIWLDDDDSEISPRDGIVQILDLLPKLVLGVRLLTLRRSSGWGVLP
jgi:hypothetical protein